LIKFSININRNAPLPERRTPLRNFNSVNTNKSNDNQPPRNKRNKTGINQYTNNNVPFVYLENKNRKLKEIKYELKKACDDVFAKFNDCDLISTAKSKYVSELYNVKDKNINQLNLFNIENYTTIKQGIRNCYHSIPPNSPIRTSFVKSMFPKDTDPKLISETLNVEKSNINRSLRSKCETLDYYLKELGFTQDKLKKKRTDLEEWLVSRCGPPSGRHKRYYTYG
jgi:hypothetical protein